VPELRSGVDGFTARALHQRDWSGLTDRNHVQLGLDLLADLDHLAAKTASGTDRGGRPKVVYTINPMSRPWISTCKNCVP
jgi:hypothetical protein